MTTRAQRSKAPRASRASSARPGNRLVTQTGKKRPPPPLRTGKGPTSTSWKPGQSGNPSGRPRRALAFAERVRERFEPDVAIDLALEIAADKKLSATERLAALWPLIDRGFVKPPTAVDVTVERGETTYNFDGWTLDEKLRFGELLARARGQATGDTPVDTRVISEASVVPRNESSGDGA